MDGYRWRGGGLERSVPPGTFSGRPPSGKLRLKPRPHENSERMSPPPFKSIIFSIPSPPTLQNLKFYLIQGGGTIFQGGDSKSPPWKIS